MTCEFTHRRVQKMADFNPTLPGIWEDAPRMRRALACSYTSEAIDTLVDLMRHGKDERVRGTAAQALLDRGWGKPKDVCRAVFG